MTINLVPYPLLNVPPRFQSVTIVVFNAEGMSGAGGQVRQARVLVVEDDYFVSMEIETVLLETGCDVVGVVATAEEAIELAGRERPDLVLMDIRLAGSLDGIQAAVEIHSRFGIRSLFVTAHSDPDTRTRGERASPVGWMSKPFTSGQLKASVESALDNLGQRRG